MEDRQYKPSISSAFSEGMNLFKKAAGAMIGYWFILLMIFFATFGLFFLIRVTALKSINLDVFENSSVFTEGFFIIIFVIYFVIWALVLGLWVGYNLYMNGVYKNGKEEFGVLFHGFKHLPKVLGAYLLRFLILIPLLAVPYYFMFTAQKEYMESIGSGIADPFGLYSNPSYSISYLVILVIQFISSILFQYSTELVMLSKSSIIDAIKTSVKTGWKHFGFFLGLFIILFFMNIAGYFLFGLGLIFTVPFSMCILHVLYQRLLASPNELDISIDEFGNSLEEFEV